MSLLSVVAPTLIGVFIAVAPAHAQDTPVAVIEGLHETLLEVMKNAESLGMQGRYWRLDPEIRRRYDLERMIAVAAGSYWSSATEAERKRLADAFGRMSVSTYASRFNGYSGERFETLGERPGPRGTVLVDTRIVRPQDTPVPLTYVLSKRGDAWRIVDVVLEGSISELAVRRSEYNQILNQGGPSKLADTLNAKADQALAE